MSAPSVVPAHLSYLAIYNPSLGPTDETVRDQLVFYYSHKLEAEFERQLRERHAASGKEASSSEQEAGNEGVKRKQEEAIENEKLRQVGLAQGMVSFVK